MSCTMCSGPIWPSINMSRPTHCAYALCHHSISISRFAPTFGNITIASDESGDPHTKGSVLMGEPRPQKKEKHRNSPAEKCPYWVDKATHADIWVIKSWPTRRQLQAKLLCTYECRVVHVDDIPSREYSGSPTGGSDFTPVNTHDAHQIWLRLLQLVDNYECHMMTTTMDPAPFFWWRASAFASASQQEFIQLFRLHPQVRHKSTVSGRRNTIISWISGQTLNSYFLLYLGNHALIILNCIYVQMGYK